MHEDFPWHALITTAVELSALHVPVEKVGHEPVGVPYDANATRAIVAPGVVQVTVTRVSLIGGGPPLAHVEQKIGPSARACKTNVENMKMLRHTILSEPQDVCDVTVVEGTTSTQAALLNSRKSTHLRQMLLNPT